MIKGLARRRCFGRAQSGDAGASAVEFALVLPFLVAITLAVLDLGGAFTHKMAVQMAAEAGAQYALANGWSASGVSSAITSATKYSVSASPAPAQSCDCNNGTTVSAATCGSTCPDGFAAGTYITVNASMNYSMVLTYPYLSNPLTLTATAMVRIQ